MGRPASGRDRDEPVALPVQQQDRAADRPDPPPVCLPPAVAGGGKDRAHGSREVPASAVERRPLANHLYVLGHHLRGHPRWISAAHRQDAGDQRLGGHTAAFHHQPTEAGRRVEGEHRGHPGIGPRRHERQRRVDQDQPGHDARSGARLEQGDHSAHRVAHEDHRRPGHGLREAVQQGPVRHHVRAPPARLGQAMPGQVRGEHPAAAGEQRGDRGPVHR